MAMIEPVRHRVVRFAAYFGGGVNQLLSAVSHHVFMTDQTLSQSSRRAGRTWETWLVLGAVALISSLAVADRLTAWLIGEFPSSALLWQLRFEYLRPIGLFYDIAAVTLGALSPAEFSAVTLIAATAVAGGALTRIRLARALSCHLLLGVALLLRYFSLSSGQAIQPHGAIGMPSESYAFLGTTLALMTAALCLRTHAEYLGWRPAFPRALERLLRAMVRPWSRGGEFAAVLLGELFPASPSTRATLAVPLAPNSSRRRP